MKVKILRIICLLAIFICIGSATAIIYLRLFYSSMSIQAIKEISEVKSKNVINIGYVEESIDTEQIEQVVAEQPTLVEDNCIGILEIDSVGINAIITEGVTQKQLRYSLGHFPESPLLEDGGNFCICGHSSVIYDMLLNNLHNVKIGDIIKVTTNESTFRFRVSEMEVIEATDTYVIANTNDDRITIITCTDEGKRRLCVVGYKIEDEYVADTEAKNEIKNYVRTKGAIYPLNTLEINTINVRYYYNGQLVEQKINSETDAGSLFKKFGSNRYNYKIDN